jgi:hypothetical protein
MNIITLSAKARCGKDTAAQYILDKLSGSTSYALAACFKESIATHFSDFLTRDDVFGYGVDRNSFMIYIERSDFIERVESIYEDFGYRMDELDIDWSVVDDNNGWTIRRIMQVVGTDVGVNQIDTNIWLKEFEKAMFSLEEVYDTVVMVDCRQTHEIEFVRERGGSVIHILRETGLTDDHITEQGLPVENGDFVVENNGTLLEFFHKLDSVLEQVDI